MHECYEDTYEDYDLKKEDVLYELLHTYKNESVHGDSKYCSNKERNFLKAIHSGNMNFLNKKYDTMTQYELNDNLLTASMTPHYDGSGTEYGPKPNQLKIMTTLLEKGAELAFKKENSWSTNSYYHIMYVGNYDYLKLLMSYSKDRNGGRNDLLLKDDNDRTPLHTLAGNVSH
jgi:hypothetical protein